MRIFTVEDLGYDGFHIQMENATNLNDDVFLDGIILVEKSEYDKLKEELVRLEKYAKEQWEAGFVMGSDGYYQGDNY